MRFVPSSARVALLAGALLAALGCNSGIPQPVRVQKTLANCGQTVSGAHYAVCGHWSTTAQADVSNGHTTVVGAIDSAPRPSGDHYSVQGGTFHASK